MAVWDGYHRPHPLNTDFLGPFLLNFIGLSVLGEKIFNFFPKIFCVVQKNVVFLNPKNSVTTDRN